MKQLSQGFSELVNLETHAWVLNFLMSQYRELYQKTVTETLSPGNKNCSLSEIAYLSLHDVVAVRDTFSSSPSKNEYIVDLDASH